MSRSPLRVALYLFDGLLIAGSIACLAGGAFAAAMASGFWAILLFVGLAIERWRYKPLADRNPGPGWTMTDERFVDPESGKTVTVYFHGRTGERRYVRD